MKKLYKATAVCRERGAIGAFGITVITGIEAENVVQAREEARKRLDGMEVNGINVEEVVNLKMN